MKPTADVSVEQFRESLKQRREKLIYFWKEDKYEGSSKRNGVGIRKFSGHGRAMKRR